MVTVITIDPSCQADCLNPVFTVPASAVASAQNIVLDKMTNY